VAFYALNAGSRFVEVAHRERRKRDSFGNGVGRRTRVPRQKLEKTCFDCKHSKSENSGKFDDEHQWRCYSCNPPMKTCSDCNMSKRATYGKKDGEQWRCYSCNPPMKTCSDCKMLKSASNGKKDGEQWCCLSCKQSTATYPCPKCGKVLKSNHALKYHTTENVCEKSTIVLQQQIKLQQQS
jgi:hypothetical protein